MAMGVVNVPYSSLFNAKEEFVFYTIVGIIGKLLEFGLVIWLLGYGGNRIRAYAIIMMVTAVIQFITFHYFSGRKWPDYVKWRFVRGWSHYKEALIYSSYNLFSGAAGMARSQGCTLLINYLFGTKVNGSFSVAKAVERHVSSFSTRFQEAAGPQVTQSYSSGDNERVYFLTSRVGKYSMLMMLLAFFPLWAEMGFVLDVWLAEVPEGAMTFCRLILLMLFVAVTDGGISHVVNASGKVARFRTIEGRRNALYAADCFHHSRHHLACCATLDDPSYPGFPGPAILSRCLSAGRDGLLGDGCVPVPDLTHPVGFNTLASGKAAAPSLSDRRYGIYPRIKEE